MREFSKILYVCRGLSDEREGLKQALVLAHDNNASFKVLVVSPELPDAFAKHRDVFDQTVMAHTRGAISDTRAVLKLPAREGDVDIDLIHPKAPAVSVIQHVLRDGYDLVIKEVEPHKRASGFKAIDMDLLRKCPVPVWLCRPILNSQSNIKVAVAIDPEGHDEVEDQLSVRMVQLARALADAHNHELDIISCWEHEFETHFRANPLYGESEAVLNQMVENTKSIHFDKLHALIQRADLSGAYHVHHLRGDAEHHIPHFVEKNGIDVLVMGTLGRTGIPGFMIGNTAENIVNNLSCSLIALKPKGFMSPVHLD